jgi:hypothetical protein
MDGRCPSYLLLRYVVEWHLPIRVVLQFGGLQTVAVQHVPTSHSKGPEKVTRGGVNESQSKFLTKTWPISQN